MDNPWLNLPNSALYVLPEDRPYIERFNSGRTGTNENYHIHLDVRPEPYMGRPDAPVLLLNGNPGYGEDAIPFHQHDTYFIASHRRNLLHETSEYPLYLVDPKNSMSSGYVYWAPYLRELIVDVGREKVAKQLFIVEYFPYASRAYGFGTRTVIPSQRYSFHLVREAIKRQAIIILMRKKKEWVEAIPELLTYPAFYILNNPQRVYITQGNCPDGYPLAVRKLRA